MDNINTSSVTNELLVNQQRLTQKQKDANDKEYYKRQVNAFVSRAFSSMMLGYGEINEFTRKKVNYDLFDNIINIKDFEYVCQPYGAQQGEMPAKMVNRDISSGKIKLLLGMEMQRPFGWSVIAVNEEATTRKLEEENKRLQDFVIGEIMTPIQQEIELKYQQQVQGKKLTEQQQQQIQQQIAQEIQSATPPEVQEYMLRKHKDPAEVLASQIMNYLVEKENIRFKFNKGWKHALLAGEEIYWVGILNNKPTMRVVNPLYFDCERTPDHDFFEEASWGVYELRLTPDEIVNWFGDELTNDQIDEVYASYPYGNPQTITSSDFNVSGYAQFAYTIRVIHAEWKSLRLIKFLTYQDSTTGQVEEMIVSEDYKLKKSQGDISIREEWIPELQEGYKIGDRIYVHMGPVLGQQKDINNLNDCKLRYHGAAYDNLNSDIIAVMDRIKPYQYFYNIIMYRIEMLMASDKGKWLIFNYNMIPKNAGIDIKQWLYYIDALKIGFADPNEEGNKNNNGNMGEVAKEIDMSLVSDIQKYIGLAQYIENKAGSAVGISPQMEAQIGPNDAVTNTKQSIMQSSYILEPLFDLHNQIKRNVLQTLIEVAKVCYVSYEPTCLSYVLDDMSLGIIKLDKEGQDLLDNSTYGVFVSNSSKSFQAKQLVEDLAHAAIQNQAIGLSDVIKIVRSDSVQEAEELLETSEQRKSQQEQSQQQSQQQAQADEAEKARQHEREGWEHEKEMIVLKETQRRQTELEKAAVQAVGFDKDKDMNKNNQPDALDIAEHFENAKTNAANVSLQRDKLNHTKTIDKEKLRQADEKLEIDRKKANKSTSK